LTDEGIKGFIDELGKLPLDGKIFAVFDTYMGKDFEKTVKKMERRINEKAPCLKRIMAGLSIKVQEIKDPVMEGELHKCKEFGKKISKIVVFVSFSWIVQSVGRLSFAALGTPAGMGQFLGAPISYATSAMLFVMFLFLGVLDLLPFPSLNKEKMGLLEHTTDQYCNHSLRHMGINNSIHRHHWLHCTCNIHTNSIP
jgi:hypothetical protein